MRLRSVHVHRLCLIGLGLLTALCWPQAVIAQTMPEPPEEIVISQLHLFIVPLGQRLQITEHYLLGNTGETPYTGRETSDGEHATVAFPLPAAAESVQFEEIDRINERYQIVEGAIIDSLPVPPGEATLEVRFTYELPYADGQNLSRTFALPVQAAVVMVMGEEMAIESSQLTSMGPLSPEQVTANAYAVRRPLAAGETLTFAVVPPTSPQAPRTRSDRETNWEIGLGALALAVAVALSYRWLSASPVPPLPDEARPLVEALARLEQAAHAAGDLPDATYQQQRADLRAELRALLREVWGRD